MKIRDLESNSNSTNEKIKNKYISLNSFSTTFINIARLNEDKEIKV